MFYDFEKVCTLFTARRWREALSLVGTDNAVLMDELE
jgi:hypothetical protein